MTPMLMPNKLSIRKCFAKPIPRRKEANPETFAIQGLPGFDFCRKRENVLGQCDLFCKGQSNLSSRPSGRTPLFHGDTIENIPKSLR